MSKVLTFTRFANGLKLQTESPEHLDCRRLSTSYQAFVKTLVPSETDPSQKKLCEAFTKKYHVILPSDSSFKEEMIAYTNIFRRMFPVTKVESQGYGFQIQHSKQNPFVVQWEVIGNFIKKSPTSLNTQLSTILSKNPNFDTKRTEVKALLDAGAKITQGVVINALSCDDFRFFELLRMYGYQPTDMDLHFLFSLKDFDKKAAKTKVLIDLGVKIHPDTVEKTFLDLDSLKLLISYGYKLSSTDFARVLKITNTEKALSYLELFKAAGYVFSETEYLAILDQHITSRSPELTNKLLQIVYPNQKLDSALFQKLFPHVYTFLALGYQPSFQDLQKAATVRNTEAVRAIIDAKKTPWTSDEVLCVLSCGLKQLIPKYAFTQEVFKKALEQNINLTLIIKDNHDYSNPIRNQSEGYYAVTHDDLLYALPKVSSGTFDLLIHCWSYSPSRELFRAILKDRPTGDFFAALIKAGYTVNSEDFRYACKTNCSMQTLSMLVNYGRTQHSHAECIDYGMYTGRTASYSVFDSDNAGYITTKEDLEFAREIGSSEEVLELIKDNMSRKRFYMYRDDNVHSIFFGCTRKIYY